MFALVVVNDTIRIQPHNLDKPIEDNVRDEIHAKYSNKVIPDQGLVIGLHGWNTRGDAYLYPGDGGAHVRTQFRLAVFRPFVGQVMVGRVCDCDHSGVQVTVGFFQHIIIPADHLRQPAFFDQEDPEKKAWYWDYEGNRLYLDKGEEIRFLVTSVEFTKPKATPVETKALAGSGLEIKTIGGPKQEEKKEKLTLAT